MESLEFGGEFFGTKHSQVCLTFRRHFGESEEIEAVFSSTPKIFCVGILLI